MLNYGEVEMIKWVGEFCCKKFQFGDLWHVWFEGHHIGSLDNEPQDESQFPTMLEKYKLECEAFAAWLNG